MQNKGKIKDIYTLSPLQEGIFFHVVRDPASASYFEQRSYRHHGPLDTGVLGRSLAQLAERHDVLRTAFLYEGLERPVQVVLKDRRPPFCCRDLSAAPDPEAEIRTYREDDRRQLFDLKKDPLLRMAVLRAGPDAYEIVWSFHHILFDGWSLGILNGELWALYQGLLPGPAATLPRPKPYSAYIKWLSGKDPEASRLFWKNNLAGYQRPVGVPGKIFGGQGDDNAYEQAEEVFVLSEPETTRLREVAKSLNVTFNTVIQALWGVLIGKYHHTGDVVFGAVVSGRSSALEGVESMVGLFINTIPVRVRAEGRTTLPELLRQVQQEALATEPFHHSPLADVQAQTVLGAQLLDHILVFENYPFLAAAGQEGQHRSGDISVVTQSNYDLNVVIIPGQELVIKLNYNRRAYEAAIIRNIPGHLHELVTQLCTHPDRPVEALNVLTAEEEEALLVGFQGKVVDYGRHSMEQLFARAVLLHPQALVLAEGKLTYCYGQLDWASAQVAAYLQGQAGWQSATRVGMVLERGWWQLVAMVGVLKAGGVLVPVDPAYPLLRKEYLLEDAGVEVLLTEGACLVELLDSYRGGVLLLDSQLARLPAPPQHLLAPAQVHDGQAHDGQGLTDASPAAGASASDAPAGAGRGVYVLYTSGSTGRPKGVLVSQPSLLNLVHWHGAAFGVGPASRASLYATTGFDASQWEVWPYLLKGASLHVVANHQRLEPAALVAFLKQAAISHCFLPTPVCEQLVTLSGQLPGGLCLLTGGDRLQQGLAGVRLFNNYGPTEATVVTTSGLVRAERGANASEGANASPGASGGEGRGGRVALGPGIGRPIANTQVLLLDGQGRLVPVGVEGELYVGGAALSEGYCNQVELTGERFVANPYGKGRLYRTGDRARWLAGGELEYLGRHDKQVKLRGYRIELGEIESQLLLHPLVEQAYVLALADEQGETRLVGYYQARQALPGRALKAFLSSRLPAYMVPLHYQVLECLPLTANGKVDRLAFPAPQWQQEAGPGAEAATAGEAALLLVWQGVLGGAELGVEDNFFERGGHSLKAVQLVSRIHQQLGVSLPLNAVFLHPTVRQMAALLEQTGPTTYRPLAPVEEQEYHSVSHAQKRLWIVDRLEPGQTAYNVPGAGILNQRLEVAAFRQSVHALLSRHESLRTVFIEVGGEPRQKVLPPPAPDAVLGYRDLRGQPANLELARQLADEEAAAPFNLRTGPLLRVNLLQLRDDQFVLLTTVHHIVNDAVSMQLFVQELVALYNACHQGRPPALPPLRVQYKDFAAWHNQQLRDEHLHRHRTFWQDHFRGEVPLADLPLDYPRPRKYASKGRFIHFELEPALAEGIRRLGHENNTTLFMTALAAVYVLLHKYTRQTDFVVGTPVAGRAHEDLHGQIGFFVNVLPLRSKVSGQETFRALLGRVRQGVLAAFEHQAYPFERLVADLKVTRDPSRNPLFDVVVTADVLPAAAPVANDGVLHENMLVPLVADRSLEVCKYDLRFRFAEADGRMVVNLLYNQALFKHERMLVLRERLVSLLEDIVADAGRPIDHYSGQAAFESETPGDLIVADFNF